MRKQKIPSRAVDRALSIIELVAKSTNGLSNSDISRRLNIPKSSASYILSVMENRAFLRRDEDRKYRLGLTFMSLTGDALKRLDVREISRPILKTFVKKSRLPAHLAILDSGHAVYVEKVESEKSFIKMDIWVGHRLPIHTTAIGKVLVSGLSDEEILEILEQRGMEKKTRKSITSPKQFLRAIKKVREFGFAVDNEENSNDVRCIAAPIFGTNGDIIATLGTSNTILHIDEGRLPKIVELVKDAADQVSKQMGFNKK